MRLWQTVVTVMVLVFTLAIAQALLAGPATDVSNDLNESGDYDNEYFDGNDLIGSWTDDWLNMGLAGIFGTLVFGAAVVLRRELTRRRRR